MFYSLNFFISYLELEDLLLLITVKKSQNILTMIQSCKNLNGEGEYFL